MTNLTIATLEQWSKDNARLALAVCTAQAFAECEKERVTAYILPIFQKYTFRVNPEFSERRKRTFETITHPDQLYLTDEEEKTVAYFEECDRAHREHGFTGPHGHCPALVAEELQRQAERALLDSGCELLGLDHHPHRLEDRKKLLDLLLGTCLKAARELGLKPMTFAA